MGNTIVRGSTDPYIVDNDFEDIMYLTSTLTITNVNAQHAGLYQFVLSLNNGDVMSREASLSVLKGIKIFIQIVCICIYTVASHLTLSYLSLHTLYEYLNNKFHAVDVFCQPYSHF